MTADCLVRAATRFERLGLDAAAATIRVVERDAREVLRELRVLRAEAGAPYMTCNCMHLATRCAVPG
jgi:hypothetical protein